MSTTTYSVNVIDSDTPAAWMSASHIVSCVPGAQDSGRVRFVVETSDPAALESALDADDDVTEYLELTSCVVVEVMPSQHVSSHEAAGNWGSYPHNGAQRYITTRSWAEEVTRDAEYDHIVRTATARDLSHYEQLPETW